MHGEIIAKELKEKVNEGKGCIIFDIGCFYNPYDYENIYDKMITRYVLTFLDKLNLRLFVDGNELEDCKLNHRYPNGYYTTISRKIGRKVSKLGYPYFVEPEDFRKKLEVQLDVEFVRGEGDESKVIDRTTLILPVQLNLDAEHPVCSMSMRYLFSEKDAIEVYSWKSCEDGGWRQILLNNFAKNESNANAETSLKIGILNEGGLNRFEAIFSPPPEKLETLAII